MKGGQFTYLWITGGTASYPQISKLSPFLVFLISLTGCGGGGESGPVSAPPVADTAFVATSVDQALDYAVGEGVDGIWVYVDDGDAPASFKSAGVQNRATREPAALTALFKIASVSKMFIAVSTVKLIHARTLQVDDTLGFWLPDLAGRIQNADTITVGQLLQHRSGVPDFDTQAGFSWESPHTSNDALLSFVLDKPADFAPDARYEYSNTNYLLLGRVLDTALGYSHHEFVQNTILSPLGMVDTYSLLNAANRDMLAHGYWNGVDRTFQDFVAPGGSMISTARDVGIFLRALATGVLLNADEKAVFASLSLAYAHSGWLPGYQSVARYDDRSDTVLVQLVNTTGGTSEQVSQRVYDALVDLLRGG